MDQVNKLRNDMSYNVTVNFHNLNTHIYTFLLKIISHAWVCYNNVVFQFIQIC